MPPKKTTKRETRAARSSVRESDTPGEVTCRMCGKTEKKGAKSQPGQNDFQYVCASCGAKKGGYPA